MCKICREVAILMGKNVEDDFPFGEHNCVIWPETGDSYLFSPIDDEDSQAAEVRAWISKALHSTYSFCHVMKVMEGREFHWAVIVKDSPIETEDLGEQIAGSGAQDSFGLSVCNLALFLRDSHPEILAGNLIRRPENSKTGMRCAVCEFSWKDCPEGSDSRLEECPGFSAWSSTEKEKSNG